MINQPDLARPLTPRRITKLWRLCLTALVLESAGFIVKSSPCYHVGRNATYQRTSFPLHPELVVILIGDMRLVENSDGSQHRTKLLRKSVKAMLDHITSRSLTSSTQGFCRLQKSWQWGISRLTSAILMSNFVRAISL
jgi:hypothetical protein